MVIPLVYTLDELKQIIIPIAQKYEVPSVYIYGSYARGEAMSIDIYSCTLEEFIEPYQTPKSEVSL